MRREFLLKNGLNFRYPELTHGEDGLFMYEVGLCAPKSAEIKLALYCYREHSGLRRNGLSLWKIAAGKSVPSCVLRKFF